MFLMHQLRQGAMPCIKRVRGYSVSAVRTISGSSLPAASVFSIVSCTSALAVGAGEGRAGLRAGCALTEGAHQVQ